MVVEEDAPSLEYAHGWNPSSELSLDEFLQKNKPTVLRNDGRNSKPFIWVISSDAMEGEDHSEAIEEAKVILDDTVKQVSEVQANDEIPLRANKKKGLKSKKEVREEIQSKATLALKEIAQKHGFVAGKWLAFAPDPQVEGIFTKLAHSLISGELSHTRASQVRVTTHPAADVEGGSYQHALSIYFPDVYDEEMARDVMKVLLRHHGLKLSGAKANLYTALGLDSKHASGIPSTVWKGTGAAGGLLNDTDIQSLRSAYYEEQGASNGAGNEGSGSQKKDTNVVKRQAKIEEENPFGSDDDDTKDDPKPAKGKVAATTSKKKPPPASKKRPASDSDDEEQGAPPKKAVKPSASTKGVRGAGPKPKVQVGKKKLEDSDSD